MLPTKPGPVKESELCFAFHDFLARKHRSVNEGGTCVGPTPRSAFQIY